MIRLYNSGFKLVVPPKKGSSGNEPFGIAFSPDGAKLAVGYHDVAAVDLFDGRSLAPLPGPNLMAWRLVDWRKVAWSADGAALFAGGLIMKEMAVPFWRGLTPVEGERRALQAGNDNTIMGLAALPDGGLLVAAADPFLAVLDADGSVRWARLSPNADFRAQHENAGNVGGRRDCRFRLCRSGSLRCASICARANSATIPPPMSKPPGRSRTGFLSKAGKTSPPDP